MKMKVRDLKRKATPLASPVKYSAVGEGGGSDRREGEVSGWWCGRKKEVKKIWGWGKETREL